MTAAVDAMSTIVDSATITRCPTCGVSSSEDYDGHGSCFACWERHSTAGATLEGATTGITSSAASDQPVADAELRFVSAAELKRSTPEEPEWILNGYVAQGCLTMLPAKPKVGKSTLVCGLLAACARGDDTFLGKALRPGPVVYVAEETSATLAHKLPDSDDIRVLTRDAAWPKPNWATLITAATAEAHRIGAKLLIVDTLPFWAGMPAESEKDAGAALLVMSICVEAARTGLAVLLPAHSRKGGGEDGEGIRGSSAFAGSVDIIIELERIPDQPRQRALLTLSRFPATPGTLVCELDDGEWRVVSEEADRGDTRAIAAQQRAAADRQAILAALEAGGPLTRTELEDVTSSPARQWHPQLEALLKEGLVSKSGGGKKGDPYRYEKVRTDSAQHCAESGGTQGMTYEIGGGSPDLGP